MRIEGSNREMLYGGRMQTNSAEGQNFLDKSTSRTEEYKPVEFGEAFRVEISQEAYRKQAEAARKAEMSADMQKSHQKKVLQMKSRQIARESYREDRRLQDQQNKLQRAKFLLEGYLRTSQIDASI